MPVLGPETPVVLPVLSRGKHRRPRKGACFMEFASYLAGERWSDHPQCTHPLLASMARMVNDSVSDHHRPRLAELIPAVIGLNSDDLHLDALIVRRATVTGLPVVAAERQRVLAVAALVAEWVLAELDGRNHDSLSEMTETALASAPHAARWARDFASNMTTTFKGFRRHAGPTAVRGAVDGIAQACIADPDQLLHDLLVRTIDDCLAWRDGHEVTIPQPDAAKWQEACTLTVTGIGEIASWRERRLRLSHHIG